VLRLVEQVVPATFGSMDSVRAVDGDARKHYAFEATRGPFTAFATGREMHLRATFAYEARGYFKPRLMPTISAGCGNATDRPRLVVELATPLSLTPDWHLVSHARLVTIKPASTDGRDRCDAGVLPIDITDRVVGVARSALTAKLSDIDRKVGTVSLSGHVTEWWALLNRPIRLTDSVWLMLHPERLRIGNVSGEARVLTVPVSLDARPRIVTGQGAATVATPAATAGQGHGHRRLSHRDGRPGRLRDGDASGDVGAGRPPLHPRWPNRGRRERVRAPHLARTVVARDRLRR
jgi:hypothetical protein